MTDELTPFEEQLKSGYEFVRQLLSEDGMFPAFAIVVDDRQRRKVLVSDDRSPDLLCDQLIDRFANSAPPAFIILFYEVEIANDGQSHRAVVAHIDVFGGVNRVILNRFEFACGELIFEAPEISEVPRRILQRN